MPSLTLRDKLADKHIAENVIANLVSTFGNSADVIEDKYLDILQIKELSTALSEAANDLLLAKEAMRDGEEYLQIDPEIQSKIIVSKISKAVRGQLILVNDTLRLYDNTGKYKLISLLDASSEKNLRDLLQGLAGSKKIGRKFSPILQKQNLAAITKDFLSSITMTDSNNRFIAFENGFIADGQVYLVAWNSNEGRKLLSKYDERTVPRFQLEHGTAEGVKKMMQSLEAPYVVRKKTMHLANNDERTAKRIECMLALNLTDDISLLQSKSKEFLDIYGIRDAGKSSLIEMLSRAADGIYPNKDKTFLVRQTAITGLEGFELAESISAGWILSMDDVPDEQISAKLESQLKQVTSHTAMATSMKNVQKQDQVKFSALVVILSNYALRKSSKDDVLFERMKVLNVMKPVDKTDNWDKLSRDKTELAKVMEYFLAYLELMRLGKEEILKDTKQMKDNVALVQIRDNSLLQYIEDIGGPNEAVEGKDSLLLKEKYNEYCRENDLTPLKRQIEIVLQGLGFTKIKKKPTLNELDELASHFEFVNDKEYKKFLAMYQAKERVDNESMITSKEDTKLLKSSSRWFWTKSK